MENGSESADCDPEAGHENKDLGAGSKWPLPSPSSPMRNVGATGWGGDSPHSWPSICLLRWESCKEFSYRFALFYFPFMSSESGGYDLQ